MAWHRGNNPLTFRIREGRILCEAMYAINEREDCLGLAKSTWLSGLIAADPGVDALAGYDVARPNLQQVVIEMRAAIETVLAVGARPYFIDGANNQYTKAQLLTDAFGAADWCVLAGKAINGVQPISEILKAVELLIKVEEYQKIYASGKKVRIKAWTGAAQPSRNAARNMALAQASVPWANNTGTLEASLGDYTDYRLWMSRNRGYLRLPTAFTVDACDLIARATEYYGGAYTPAVPGMRFYDSTAAAWAADPWGRHASETLRHTWAMPAGTGEFTQAVADSSFLAGGYVLQYTMLRHSAAVPFPDDATTDGCGIANDGGPGLDGAKIRIRCTGTHWTYN